MLLLSEQHSGKTFDDPELEFSFIEKNMGTFLTIMAAAANSNIDLIALIAEIKNQWLKEL